MEPQAIVQKFSNLVISAWMLQNRRISSLINKLSDSDFQNEIAPGRNTALYLLGHLIAYNDTLMPLFGIGEKMFPAYEELFLCAPDKYGQTFPSALALRSAWKELNERLTEHFYEIRAGNCFFDESLDLAEERLKVMIGIVNHQSYHLGQLILLL